MYNYISFIKIGYKLAELRTKYDRFWPKNWANINIFEWNQHYMKGNHKLDIIHEYQLNIYFTVDSVVK